MLELLPPPPGMVRIRMLCAPINPSDLNMLEGKYGEARPLPDTPGNEGVGRVVAAGPGGERWVGRTVLVDRESWREEGNWPIGSLVEVPAKFDSCRAATLRINPPTAWRMLHDFVALKPGDWVVQNAPTSGVGRAVIEIARSRGWRTLNLVRRRENAGELLDLGADAVVLDGPEAGDEAKPALGGYCPRLGLNAVGGSSGTRVAGFLAAGGTLVTYGAMSKEALKIPNGFLIFRDISFRGFWLTRWLKTAREQEVRGMFESLFALAQEGHLAPRIAATFPLSKCKDAVALAASGPRGKVMLEMREGQALGAG